MYSGPTAGHAYAQLVPWRDAFDRVVLVGVPHRAPVHGLALCSADEWATPLGNIEVDLMASTDLLVHRGAVVDDRAHAREHSLEVHLPFLQRVLAPGWRLLPVIAGGADTVSIADLLGPWWSAPRTLVVVSTDLSHYHQQTEAQRLDRATADDIVHARWEGLDGNRACGASGVRAALELTRRHHQHVQLLDLRT
ncbi:MAG TPA: AmmeMemoRadiSam system protein B, partial [Acidimicrobiaceae bacterium]|nr:AmmeMemoRadiSam system protein B [Acidimicrobiaceae bacterium]